MALVLVRLMGLVRFGACLYASSMADMHIVKELYRKNKLGLYFWIYEMLISTT